MTNPISIIADQIYAHDSLDFRTAERAAKVAANALTDDQIIANAATALRANGWQDHNGMTAEMVARTVLGSVWGA